MARLFQSNLAIILLDNGTSRSTNGVLGNDDRGSGQIVGHTEVILRSLTTISNGKSASLQRLIAHCWRVSKD
jgi:hypothetical protein